PAPINCQPKNATTATATNPIAQYNGLPRAGLATGFSGAGSGATIGPTGARFDTTGSGARSIGGFAAGGASVLTIAGTGWAGLALSVVVGVGAGSGVAVVFAIGV